MHLTIRFVLVNSMFSQEYADEQSQGEETEENMKYHWEDEIALKNEIESLNWQTAQTFTLRGQKGKEGFEFPIEKCRILECVGEDGSVTPIVVSESLILDIEQEEGEDRTRVSFFLDDQEVHYQPMPGAYLDVDSLPDELVQMVGREKDA